MIRKFTSTMDSAAVWCLVAAYFLFPVALAPGYVAMGLALLFGLLCGRYAERWRTVRGEPLVWAALALYALILVGALRSAAPPGDIELHLTKYAKLLSIPVFLALLVQERYRRHCLDAFVAAMLLVLACTYANIWWDLPWSKTHNQGWGVDHTVVGDYITQSLMMSFLAVVALTRAIAARATGVRVAWSAVVFLAAISVTQLSSGRTGYLLLSLGLVTCALASFGGRRRLLVAAGLVLMLVVMLGTSTEVHHRVLLGLEEAQHSGDMQVNSIGGRVNFWTHTMDMIMQRPWLGWGTGSYHGQWCAQVTEPGWCWLGGWHPHNQYLFLWMELGLPGLIAFLVLVASPFLAVRTCPAATRPLLLSFGVMFAVNSMINAALWSSRESHFFVMMLVLLYADAVFSAPARAGLTDTERPTP